jgi:hypothetical protein
MPSILTAYITMTQLDMFMNIYALGGGGREEVQLLLVKDNFPFKSNQDVLNKYFRYILLPKND